MDGLMDWVCGAEVRGVCVVRDDDDDVTGGFLLGGMGEGRGRGV